MKNPFHKILPYSQIGYAFISVIKKIPTKVKRTLPTKVYATIFWCPCEFEEYSVAPEIIPRLAIKKRSSRVSDHFL